MPAHFTGIFGHKPSFGIVPSRGYLYHVGGGWTEADINVVGPLGRSVGDLELLLGVLAGPDDHRAVLHLDLPAAPTSTRIGVWLDDQACPVDSEVLTILGVGLSSCSRPTAHRSTPIHARSTSRSR